MLPLKLLLHILTAAAAVIVVALDYAYRDRRTKRFRQLRTALWGAMGAGLLLGVVVITADEYTKRYELDTLSTQLRLLRGAAEQTAGAITGGESFPYVNILGDGAVILINEGKNPLYDISIRMWDPSDYGSVKTSTEFWALEQRAFHFYAPSMAPKSTLIAGRISFSKALATTLEVDLIARNGFFHEQIGVRESSGRHVVAYRVFRGEQTVSSRPILQRADPAFPRDIHGEPTWNANRASGGA